MQQQPAFAILDAGCGNGAFFIQLVEDLLFDGYDTSNLLLVGMKICCTNIFCTRHGLFTAIRNVVTSSGTKEDAQRV